MRLTNYLEAEAPIIARLKDQVPALREVYGMAELATIRDRTAQFAPCACVVYDGDTLREGQGARAGNGAVQLVYQRWVVWLVVRNVRDVAGGSGARADAGTLLAAILPALAGWSPIENGKPLRRGPAPRPLFEEATLHFPVLFELPVITL